MIIPITVNKLNFYSNYLKCFNPVLKLKNREIQVLAKILDYYINYEPLEYSAKIALLYSMHTRKKIREEVGMSEASFNNHLVQLKAKRMLKDDGSINETLLKDLKKGIKEIQICYKLKVHDA